MTKAAFQSEFNLNLEQCQWRPDDLHSVFTQYDSEFYRKNQEQFTQKYRSFWAVAKTLMPASMIELGCRAGSAADAYISASGASYTGIDTFESATTPDGALWEPYRVFVKLMKKRHFATPHLRIQNLRDLKELPATDFVVVDAAHDYENALADMKLAATADPKFIFVDDYNGDDVQRAVAEWFSTHAYQWYARLHYNSGGIVIKLRD